MNAQLPGIHHITAVAGDPQRNVDFYAGVLGLRMVKRTVNFDAPDVYHFYYGDDQARPGTILTFFPFPGARRGRRGSGQVAASAFAVPAASLDYWTGRLSAHDVVLEERLTRFEEPVLAFADPDGLVLELIATSHDERPGWDGGPIPAAHAIRGFHSATLWVRDAGPSAHVLTDILGFHELAREGERVRYAAGEGAAGDLVDLVALPDMAPGSVSAGIVHHIAWRTPDDEQQHAWRRTLEQAGLSVTPVQDRQYFHSIYFHEPGGVLYEIATDTPGFAIDELPAELGTQLKLPPWLEGRRSQLERLLPPIQLATRSPGAGA